MDPRFQQTQINEPVRIRFFAYGGDKNENLNSFFSADLIFRESTEDGVHPVEASVPIAAKLCTSYVSGLPHSEHQVHTQ